jgi:hypothetical protein
MKKNAINRPIVPIMRDVEKGTNLTQDEMTTFEKANFLLSKKLKCPLKILFGDDAFIHIKRPLDANACLRIQNQKSIHYPSIFKILIQQQNKWKVKHVLVAKILPPINVPLLAMVEYIASL